MDEVDTFETVEILDTIEKKQERIFKIILVGDTGVGKTSLLFSFVDNHFMTSYITTIGVDFRIKSIMVDDIPVKFQIWDTAGQERFRTITSVYYRGSDGIMFVYDITDVESFKNIKNWIDDVNNNQENYRLVKLLIANKSDMNEDRKISYEKANKFAEENDLTLIETSAKDLIGVKNAFTIIGKIFIEKTSVKYLRSSSETGMGSTIYGSTLRAKVDKGYDGRITSLGLTSPSSSFSGAKSPTDHIKKEYKQIVQKKSRCHSCFSCFC